MSDSDDTDVLLLIPPDFFLVYSDSEESYNNDKSRAYCDSHCSVVDNLVSQVYKLENRVNRIEVHSTEVSLLDSCNSTIIEMSDNHYRSTDFRLNSNTNHLNPSSTRSTPQKLRTRLTLNSLPSTPSTEKPKYKRSPPVKAAHNTSTDADESSFTTTPERKQNKKILGEIDQFLSNVKTIQLLSAQKSNPDENIPIEEPSITLNDLKSGIEATSNKINSLNLKDVDKLLQSLEKQQRIMDSQPAKHEKIIPNQTWKCGETIASIPDLGFGLREPTCAEATSHHQETDLNIKSDSSESIPHTVLERHPNRTSKDIEGVQKITNHSSVQKFRQQLNLTKNPAESSMAAVNLFSLADIWNTNGTRDVTISEKELKKLLPRLEEEKCRRKHCEKLIQELQMKILEMQQRLAVAVQVDSAKDEAILKFHEAWEKVANRWQSLETERNSLSNRLYAIEEQSHIDVADAVQRVTQYEMELTKALDSARANQEKSTKLESERSAMLNELDHLRRDVKTTHEHLKEIATQRNELATQIANMEKDSIQDKQLLLETQHEVAQSKNVFLNCQTELSNLREEHIKLQQKIQFEQSSIVQLETQKKHLQVSLDTVRKNESTLQSEIKKLQTDMERNKLELRSFYQQQVEVLVNDKLKEFQEQLEQAEKSLQDQLRTKEQSIVRSAAKQLHKLTEKHRLEVQLLEEKHVEEMRLYELQFTKMQQQNQVLTEKLESYQARRTDIAKELHNVMENQWLEALRIINNGKSPLVEKDTCEPKKELTLDELKRLIANEPSAEPPTLERHDDKVFETPVNRKPENETQLQTYMKLLLEKVNRAALDKNASQESSDSLDMIPWHQLIAAKSVDKIGKDRHEKPPWK